MRIVAVNDDVGREEGTMVEVILGEEAAYLAELEDDLCDLKGRGAKALLHHFVEGVSDEVLVEDVDEIPIFEDGVKLVETALLEAHEDVDLVHEGFVNLVIEMGVPDELNGVDTVYNRRKSYCFCF